jgi:hypothetical protein
VHGALRHFSTGLADAVAQELNAAADNPLVSVAGQTLISNGNFHPMVMAIAADALLRQTALRIAVDTTLGHGPATQRESERRLADGPSLCDASLPLSSL